MTRQPPTPRLQIALDTLDLPTALGPLQQAAPYVDVIECGTILVLCEGFHAVRAIRALFPDKQILADVRIAEAGSKIARLAFEAGADLVSCVAGASMSTIRQVCQVADELGARSRSSWPTSGSTPNGPAPGARLASSTSSSSAPATGRPPETCPGRARTWTGSTSWRPWGSLSPSPAA